MSLTTKTNTEYFVIKKDGKFMTKWSDRGHPHCSGIGWTDDISKAFTTDGKYARNAMSCVSGNPHGRGAGPSHEQKEVRDAIMCKIRQVQHTTYEYTGVYKV
jgi:hypothetical protein